MHCKKPHQVTYELYIAGNEHPVASITSLIYRTNNKMSSASSYAHISAMLDDPGAVLIRVGE